jgi:hypothetical protein
VAAATCAEAMAPGTRSELIAATSAADCVQAVDDLLRQPVRANAIGIASRQRVLAEYGWEAQLAAMDDHLRALGAEPGDAGSRSSQPSTPPQAASSATAQA